MRQDQQSESLLPPTDRILEAASDEFAAHGFAGARVDAIAKRAGVNKASIYYYIGDKQAVYEGVLRRVFQRTAARVESETGEIDCPEAKLRVFIRSMARCVDQNKHMAPIMLREVASGGQYLPDTAIQDMGRIISLLQNILTQGRTKQNRFREVSPALLHLMITGTTLLFKSSEPIRQRFSRLPEKLESPLNTDFSTALAELETVIVNGIQQRQP